MPTPLTSILEIHSVSLEARAVLLGLLSFRNKTTGECYPKIPTLSKRLGTPERTVYRRLRELREAGVLEIKQHRGASSYVFHSVENPANSAKNGRANSANSGRANSANVGRVSAFYPYMNQTDTEQTVKNRAAAVKLEDVVEPVETAAAAVSVSVEITPERPAAPEAENRKAPQQLGLPLEPEKVASPPDPAEALARELSNTHPQPGLPRKAVGEVRKALAAGWSADAIRKRHAEWCEYWATLAAGKFIPMLWRWFDSGDFESKPVIRKPAVVESYADRFRRQIREACRA